MSHSELFEFVLIIFHSTAIEQAICDYSSSDTSTFKECLHLSKDKLESGLAQQKAVPSLKYGFHFAGQRDTFGNLRNLTSMMMVYVIVARYASFKLVTYSHI